MDLKVVDIRPLEQTDTSKGYGISLTSKRHCNTERRKFLKIVGMAGLGASLSSISNLLMPEKANAACYTNAYGYTTCDYYDYWYYQQYQGYLMWAYLYQMSLYQYYYNLYQPIGGSVRLENRTNETSSGEIAVTLVGSRSLDQLEDYSTVAYDIPPRTSGTLQFSNGPSGQSPGEKVATIWTANANVSSRLTVG